MLLSVGLSLIHSFSLLCVFHWMVHSSVADIFCCFHFGAITIIRAVNIFCIYILVPMCT